MDYVMYRGGLYIITYIIDKREQADLPATSGIRQMHARGAAYQHMLPANAFTYIHIYPYGRFLIHLKKIHVQEPVPLLPVLIMGNFGTTASPAWPVQGPRH